MSVGKFATRFVDKFAKDETMTLAASLAFYTALSLAPLLILFVTVTTWMSEPLQSEMVIETEKLMGVDAAKVVEVIISGAENRADLSSIASVFGIMTLLVSASLIFGELRNALNRIFDVAPSPNPDMSYFQIIWCYLRDRLMHIGLAVIFIFTLIVSLIATSLISAVIPPEQRALASTINIGASFASYVILFTLMFRFLPEKRQPWRQAALGGGLTALLFVIGKELIGIYLGRSAVGSAYGAAGSVIVLLVWVYYSTMITFIGAQVSALWIHLRGRS